MAPRLNYSQHVRAITGAVQSGRMSPEEGMRRMNKCQNDLGKGPLVLDQQQPQYDGQFPGVPQLRGLEVGIRQGYTESLRVPSITALAAQTTSTQYPLVVQKNGWIIGMNGTTLGDGSLAGLASIGLQLNLNGQRDFFMNGTGADFAIFDNLFGVGVDPSPFWLHVVQTDRLAFTFRNFSAATTYTPEVQVFFRADDP